MTDLIIRVERDAHDDKFVVIKGNEIEAIFYRRYNLLVYLKQRIDDLAGAP